MQDRALQIDGREVRIRLDDMRVAPVRRALLDERRRLADEPKRWTQNLLACTVCCAPCVVGARCECCAADGLHNLHRLLMPVDEFLERASRRVAS